MQLALGARASIFICSRCSATQGILKPTKSPVSNTLLQAFRAPQSGQSISRPFHSTPLFLKKKDKGVKQQPPAIKDDSTSTANPDDPLDFSELHASIAKAHAKLKDDLSKLRGGGKFNPEFVENLRVRVNKSSNDTARIADLAQCIPRGRVLTVIAGEKEHIKPISSAIQSSDLSLTPQANAQNPLQLDIPLPPPTAESRQHAVRGAIQLGEAATIAIKNARSTQQKRLRAMQLSRAARPDELRTAGDKMEKVVSDGALEAKKLLDNAKKILESN